MKSILNYYYAEMLQEIFNNSIKYKQTIENENKIIIADKVMRIVPMIVSYVDELEKDNKRLRKISGDDKN